MKRLLVFVLMLSACSSHNNPPVGGDHDSHGCKHSAGYEWCAKEKACVRMWELAKKKHLPPGQTAEEYCKK